MNFPEPATQSAIAFRILLDCMSRPGKINEISILPAQGSLCDSSWTIINTLLDTTTKTYISPALRDGKVISDIRFSTGSIIVETAQEANFIIATAPEAEPLLSQLFLGRPEYPDEAATLILQCGAINNDKLVELSGPGIKDKSCISASGIELQFWHKLNQQNKENYPLGTDVFLTCPGKIAAIARSTQIRSI